jgi:Kef-type K+ transport system membrane component KefB
VASELADVLWRLVVLLVGAKLLGELAERLRQPAVLGELVAGVLLGPTLFRVVDFAQAGATTDVLRFVAELGAVLLLFEVGLETRLRDMVAVGASSLLVALVGIVGSFAAGAGVAWLLGRVGFWDAGLLFDVFIGATFTATSVGITARVLSDMGKLATAEARIVLGAAVLDDVGGLLILALVSALAAGAVSAGALALEAALAVGFLVLAVALGARVAPWLLDRVADSARVRGATTAFAFALALAFAFLAESVGLAAIVGAFAAGIVLSSARAKPALVERVKGVGDLLVPLFFAFVGAQLDLHAVGAADAPRVALAVVVLLAVAIVGKLVAGLGVLEEGVSRYAVGVGMVPRGEVGLIFALLGLTTMVGGEPLLRPWEYAAVLLVVALSTFVTPLWLKRVLSRA